MMAAMVEVLGAVLCGFCGIAVAAVDAPARRILATAAVPFVPNAGQWDARVAFAAQTFAGMVFVTPDGRIVYRLPAAPGAESRLALDRGALPHLRSRTPRGDRALMETLVDSGGRSIHARADSGNRSAGTVSYAIGSDESRHRDGLSAYERVRLGQVYPGIGIELRATGSNVEKVFTVDAARDPAAIRIRVDGADRLEVGANGDLIAHTGSGPIVFTAPIAYQLDATGNRIGVTVRYALEGSATYYGFALGAYDATRPVVIDPLLQSTYLGGNGLDSITAMAIHPVSGEVYVAGYTVSTNFPDMLGAEQSNHADDANAHDAFVTRLNAALTQRLQSTYIGGDGNDEAFALAIDPATGDVYVAGSTTSTDFPKTVGAAQPAKGAGKDAFVTRLNAALTTRLRSTYLGGSGDDEGLAIAIHPATGEVYVGGSTASTDFPKIAGSEQPMKGFGFDAFVARLDPTLSTHAQSTYYGGDGTDLVNGIAIHPASGEVYIAGPTTSTDFPKTAGAEQAAHAPDNGLADAFVARLDIALTTRLQATYLGGLGTDQAITLAIHPVTGEVYVGGNTTSADLPRVAGAEQAAKSTGQDAFVARLNAPLTRLLQSTYLGGNGLDQLAAMAIHPATGDVYVAGYTLSTDFPKVAGGEQPARTAQDGFVTRLDASLTTRRQSTYLGGGSTDAIQALAIHPTTGEVHVAGFTISTDFPKVANSEQDTHAADGGALDGFVSRYSIDLMGGDTVPDAFAFAPKFDVPIGSRQTSAAAQIAGISVDVPISITGGNFADYCISTAAGCACDVQPMGHASSTIGNQKYVCVRQSAPSSAPAQAKATLVVGGGWANFLVTTGTEVGSPGGNSPCSLDVDGNGNVDALTDGLLLMRAMFGMTGTAVTDGTIGSGALRSTWAQIQPFLNGNCGAGFAP